MSPVSRTEALITRHMNTLGSIAFTETIKFAIIFNNDCNNGNGSGDLAQVYAKHMRALYMQSLEALRLFAYRVACM